MYQLATCSSAAQLPFRLRLQPSSPELGVPCWSPACCFPTHLLPELHDLETLEVVELPALVELLALLGPGACVECLLDLLLRPLLLDESTAGGTGQLGEDDGCEGKVGESGGVTGDGGLLGGAIDEHLYCLCEHLDRRQNRNSWPETYALVVDDFHDGRQPTLVRAGAEQHDAADLDQPPLARCDIGVTHFDEGCCWQS